MQAGESAVVQVGRQAAERPDLEEHQLELGAARLLVEALLKGLHSLPVQMRGTSHCYMTLQMHMFGS